MFWIFFCCCDDIFPNQNHYVCIKSRYKYYIEKNVRIDIHIYKIEYLKGYYWPYILRIPALPGKRYELQPNIRGVYINCVWIRAVPWLRLYLNGRSKKEANSHTEEKSFFFFHVKRKFCESNALRSRRILDIVRVRVCPTPIRILCHLIWSLHVRRTLTVYTRKDQKGRARVVAIHEIYGYANVLECFFITYIYESIYNKDIHYKPINAYIDNNFLYAVLYIFRFKGFASVYVQHCVTYYCLICSLRCRRPCCIPTYIHLFYTQKADIRNTLYWSI